MIEFDGDAFLIKKIALQNTTCSNQYSMCLRSATQWKARFFASRSAFFCRISESET